MSHRRLIDRVAIAVLPDRTYEGPELDDGDAINVNKANIHVLAPFAAISTGREDKTLRMVTRFWTPGFALGDHQVIFDGMYGEKGFGASYDPDWEPDVRNKTNPRTKEVKPDVVNRYLKPKDDYQELVDQLKSAIDSTIDQQLPRVISPRFWAICNVNDIPALRVDHEAVMNAAHFLFHNGVEIEMPDDDGWHHHLTTCTRNGWEAFWRSHCPGYEMGDFSPIDQYAAYLMNQMVTRQEDKGITWVPLDLLGSLEHVHDVFVEKMSPKAFHLDHRPEVYRRMAMEDGLYENVHKIKSNPKLDDEGRKRRIAAECRRWAAASALVRETRVMRLQLWFDKMRPKVNGQIIRSEGTTVLSRRFASTQGVKLDRSGIMGGFRGGIE